MTQLDDADDDCWDKTSSISSCGEDGEMGPKRPAVAFLIEHCAQLSQKLVVKCHENLLQTQLRLGHAMKEDSQSPEVTQIQVFVFVN